MSMSFTLSGTVLVLGIKYAGDGGWNPSFHTDVKGKLFLSH